MYCSQWQTGKLAFGQMPDRLWAIWASQPQSVMTVTATLPQNYFSRGVNNVIMLNYNQISPLSSALTVLQADQYLHNIYKSLYHSHGYPLQSTVTNFYISQHCFVASYSDVEKWQGLK